MLWLISSPIWIAAGVGCMLDDEIRGMIACFWVAVLSFLLWLHGGFKK